MTMTNTNDILMQILSTTYIASSKQQQQQAAATATRTATIVLKWL
jgi:hypothetical protein